MKFLKKIFFLLVVCAGLQQSCSAMDVAEQESNRIKFLMRELIIGANENCRRSRQFGDDLHRLSIEIQNNIWRNEHRWGEEITVRELTFDNGENILTLFAKTCCDRFCGNCLRRFHSILNMIINSTEDGTLTDLFNSANLDGETFWSIILERKLLLILFDLLSKDFCIKYYVDNNGEVERAVRGLSHYNKNLLIENNHIILEFLSPEFARNLHNAHLWPMPIEENIFSYDRIDFVKYVKNIFNLALQNGLVGYNDLGKKLLSYARGWKGTIENEIQEIDRLNMEYENIRPILENEFREKELEIAERLRAAEPSEEKDILTRAIANEHFNSIVRRFGWISEEWNDNFENFDALIKQVFDEQSLELFDAYDDALSAHCNAMVKFAIIRKEPRIWSRLINRLHTAMPEQEIKQNLHRQGFYDMEIICLQ